MEIIANSPSLLSCAMENVTTNKFHYFEGYKHEEISFIINSCPLNGMRVARRCTQKNNYQREQLIYY